MIDTPRVAKRPTNFLPIRILNTSFHHRQKPRTSPPPSKLSSSIHWLAPIFFTRAHFVNPHIRKLIASFGGAHSPTTRRYSRGLPCADQNRGHPHEISDLSLKSKVRDTRSTCLFQVWHFFPLIPCSRLIKRVSSGATMFRILAEDLLLNEF